MSYSYHSGTGSSDTPLVVSISNNGNSLRYYYHDDGNIRCMETAWRTINYTYDHLGQLLRVDDNDTGLTTIYAYDAGFNMISEKVYAHTEEEILTTELVSERSFAYDTVWKDKMITCGGKALTYDGAGNLTSYDGTTFTWANGRRLSSVTKADGTTASYTYNHNGQRVEGKVLMGRIICYFIVLYQFISTWFCNGKTIIMDAEGCDVCVWKFRRKYLWNELKTKRLEQYWLGGDDPKRGVVFCKRKIGEMNWSHPGLYAPIRPYLSYFYVTFPVDEEDRTWKTEYNNAINAYEVNEKEFMAKMQEWNVWITNDMPKNKKHWSKW